MTNDWEIRLRLIGEEQVVRDIEAQLARLPGSRILQQTTPVTNPDELRFDVGQVAALVSAVSAAVLGGPLLPIIRQAIHDKDRSKISIESPIGKVTYEANSSMTDDEIRKKLTDMSKLI